MKLATRITLTLAVSVATIGAANAADAIKSGQWEFQTQLQAPPSREPAAAAPPAAGAGMNVTHTQCVEPERAVPSDPRRECKIEKMDRKDAVITWATVCQGAQGSVETAGTARYSGNTMEANLNVRAPNGRGGFIETNQHVSGRYLGPCPAR